LPHRFDRWKQRVLALKIEGYALYLSYKDPRVSWYARAFTAIVIGYAFSPIDLIPDFIPVLGYLDDLILIPLGVSLALKMIPAEVMSESRNQAKSILDSAIPVNRAVAVGIVAIWLILAGSAIYWVYQIFK